MIILRERLENIFFSEMYYQRGLRYCMLNKIKKAYFWLTLAANLDHEEAKQSINELIKKGFLNEEEKRK